MAFFAAPVLVFDAPNAFAIADGQIQLGAGFLFYNINETATSSSGETSLLGPTYLMPLVARMHLNVWQNFMFSPQLAYTLLPNESSDGAIKTSVLNFSLPISSAFPTAPTLTYSVGIGYLLYQIQGQGGSVTLNNSSSSATFQRPSGNINISSWNLELGLGWAVTPLIEIETLLALSNFTNSDKWTNHLFLICHFSLGGL